MLGVEDLPHYKTKFDVIFCLGVLYHRRDPITTLKNLYASLKRGGDLILDTFMIDGEDEIALSVNRYSKMPNVFFIPTVKTLQNWLERASFVDIEVLYRIKTTTEEQRRTDWILGESLEDFLDIDDDTKTIEGYPAPKRVYIKARRY
jgi:tRNA (mo5U34)-methyltransferase